MLGAALGAGFCSVGVDVIAMGIVPTGGISFIARTGDYGLGVVISASHNPAPDNGIKLIGHDGSKLPDEEEERIEALMEEGQGARPTGEGVGKLLTDRSEVGRYMSFLETIVPERLDGLKIAVDGAHGAAYELGPEILRRLGADIVTTGTEPDGMNINADGGATKPQTIQDLTKTSGADLGVAFDGDADRAVFSDDQGRLINGDRTMAIWCGHWKREGRLDPSVVVGTVMSNGGFEKYMLSQGVRVERTPVGDKHVSAKLKELGSRIGGEQSGHIIFPEHGPTGDGLVTALEVLRVLKREGRPASEFYGDYDSWPQLLVNVQVSDQNGWDEHAAVIKALEEAERSLVGRGRAVVRASGTQPMIRVMVEADDLGVRDEAAAKIVDALRHELSGEIYSTVDLTYALGD